MAAVEVVNRHFSELLTGRSFDSVDDIARIWDDLYLASLPYGRKGVAVMAVSGVDLALWDALGKAERKPVAEMIGKIQKERVRAYATGPDNRLVCRAWLHGAQDASSLDRVGGGTTIQRLRQRQRLGKRSGRTPRSCSTST